MTTDCYKNHGDLKKVIEKEIEKINKEYMIKLQLVCKKLAEESEKIEVEYKKHMSNGRLYFVLETEYLRRTIRKDIFEFFRDISSELSKDYKGHIEDCRKRQKFFEE